MQNSKFNKIMNTNQNILALKAVAIILVIILVIAYASKFIIKLAIIALAVYGCYKFYKWVFNKSEF